jgi:indoleamine 2,3-dioxygenase
MSNHFPSVEHPTKHIEQPTIIGEVFRKRGFLPATDPLTEFPRDSEFSVLDEFGRELPSLLQDHAFRQYARTLKIPQWPKGHVVAEALPALRLYYVRIGFLASAYVNQLGEDPATILPANIAGPLCQACSLLQRPPILSYDGYALYNWRRFRKDGSVALGNIDTIQNFVHLYDEHWFILVHVEIEAVAARILDAIAKVQIAQANDDRAVIDDALLTIADSVRHQVGVLQRIPEKMDPALYYRTFRPYIRFFENVSYETGPRRGNARNGSYEFPWRNRRAKQHHADPRCLHENPPPDLNADESSR